MRKKFRMLLFLCIAMFCMFTMTGCGSTLAAYVVTAYPQAVKERAQANKDIAAMLKDNKYISDELYTEICEQIDKATNATLKDVENVNTSSGNAVNTAAVANFADSVSYIYLRKPSYIDYIDDNGATQVTSAADLTVCEKIDDFDNPETLSAFVISNYIWGHHLGRKHADASGWTATGSKNNVDFFASCSDDLDTALNEKFRLPVYVFDASKITDSDQSVDEVLASINAAVLAGDISGVSNYFTELKDENGKTVTLMDEDFKIYGVSKANVGATTYNKPGYDMMITQKLWYGTDDNKYQKNMQVATLRFNEFDQDAIDEMCNTIYNNSGSYFFQVGSNGTTAAYLLEYPVSVLDTLEADGSDSSIIYGKFKQNSGIGINIGTGKIIAYDRDSNGGYKITGKAIECTDTYLTTAFKDSNSAQGISSFIAKGVTSTEIPICGGDSVKAYVPQIILRDYLEATWAPESTSYDEKLVVFGRKIRLRTGTAFWAVDNTVTNGGNTYNTYKLKYNTNNADYCAYFVDVEGNEVGTLTKLYVTDICDINKLAEGDSSVQVVNSEFEKYKVAHFPELGMQGSTKDCSVDSNETQPTQDKLAEDTTITSLQATLEFPGQYIGSVDLNNSGAQIQRFYCLTTTKGMFDSALYSDWINSTSSKASLEWWNNYLGEKGYDYIIDHNGINDYLKSNYAYELSQSGVVILDLETVAKIQNIYDEEDKDARVEMLRTIFVIIGVFLIAYAMILMLCWVVDTQVDLGFSLTNKVTLGHWIAVQYDDELPTYNNEEHTYITGKKMFVKCLIIVAVAILVIRVNVSEVVLVLINTFGRIASYAEKLIRGI